MNDIFFFSESDRRILRSLIEMVRNGVLNTQNRPSRSVPPDTSSPIYLALTPNGGIPEMGLGTGTGTGSGTGSAHFIFFQDDPRSLGRPGKADCTLLRIDDDGVNPTQLIPMADREQPVYNFTARRTRSGAILPIAQDRFGRWIGIFPESGGTGTAEESIIERIYTSSTTWTKPPGLIAVEIEVVGAGGGGGGASGGVTGRSVGSGGSGGGYVRGRIDATDLAPTEDVIIGLGGAGGVGNASGSNGGDSSFSSNTGGGGVGGTCLANGTTAALALPSTGGTAAGIGIISSGNGGSFGVRYSSTLGHGGNGADGPYGGGQPGAAGGASDGIGGEGPGAGGSGAYALTVDRTGGDGHDGTIIITEYYF